MRYANRAPKSLHFFPCWGPVRCSCGCLIPHISLCSRCWKGLKDINTRPRTTVNPTWSEHGQKAMLQAFQPSADQTTISSTFNLQCINLVFSIRMAGKVTMGTSLSQTGSKQWLWNPRPGAQRADLEVFSMQLEHAIESHYDFGVSKPIGSKMD